MAKIGLIDKFVSLVSTYEVKYLKAQQVPVNEANRQILKNLSVIANNIGKTKDLNNILNIERTILYSELSRCTDTSVDKGRITSLTNAVDDLDKAANGLKLVNNQNEYRKSSEIVSSHDIDRKNGIPRDKVHRFIDSHVTRLNNSLIFSGASFEEKLLIKERISNMKILKNEYIKLQSKALGITLPEKSRAIER